MTTTTQSQLSEATNIVISHFSNELRQMHKHDRNALMVALAAQQYYADAYPAEREYLLHECVCDLIPEDKDFTTDAIGDILQRFSSATLHERMGLITVISQIIGGT